jgi:hypothetical protein
MLPEIISIQAFVAFLDAIVGWLGVFAGEDDLSFQVLLAHFFNHTEQCCQGAEIQAEKHKGCLGPNFWQIY